MRCRNCGWDNPENISKCEKCNAPLNTPVQHESTEPVNERLKSTVSENLAFGSHNPNPANMCPKCGYPVSTDMNKCPNCDYPLGGQSQPEPSVVKCPHCGQENNSSARFCASCGSPIHEQPAAPQAARKIQRPAMGTIMAGPAATPFAHGTFCTLKPIAWQGEDVNYSPVTYSGETIVLNRSNTDSNNNSITSKEQAILSFEDGEWYIENRSELRTTYIRVGEKIKIKSGDVIVLGNREFEFKG